VPDERLGLPVAAAEDRLACFGAEAVAGRPLGRLRARAAEAQPGGEARGLAALALRLPPGDVLGLRPALRAGLRSRAGRAALRSRLLGPPLALPPARPGAGGGRLVTLSGLDGAGKSSAALALAEALRRDGGRAVVTWSRLGVDHHALHVLATLVRRVLRREMGASSAVDPTIAVAARRLPVRPSGPAGSDPVARVWPVAMALAYVRHCRRLARVRRRGVDLVCDRWTADALVDLRLRYGRHPVAERVLRTLMPRPDLAVLLSVAPETSLARKPGDQDERSLRAMALVLDELTAPLGLLPVDGERAPAEVRAALTALAQGVQR
jgi:thymidylate kinase